MEENYKRKIKHLENENLELKKKIEDIEKKNKEALDRLK
jgi:hypothetical protein